METRASNKTAHPGNVIKATTKRRTKAEVQEERVAKAKAKAAQEGAQKTSIGRTAKFESADKACEDVVDATPRPLFTPGPKQRRASERHQQVQSSPSPVVETSDISTSDEVDAASFVPSGSESSESEEKSVTRFAYDLFLISLVALRRIRIQLSTHLVLFKSRRPE
jgi:hypothetical protein